MPIQAGIPLLVHLRCDTPGTLRGLAWCNAYSACETTESKLSLIIELANR
jgi:hypothetical protein